MDIRDRVHDLIHSLTVIYEELLRVRDIVETEHPGLFVSILADLASKGIYPPTWALGEEWLPHRRLLLARGKVRFPVPEGVVIIIPLYGRGMRVRGPVRVEAFDGHEWRPVADEVPEGFLSARLRTTLDGEVELVIQ